MGGGRLLSSFLMGSKVNTQKEGQHVGCNCPAQRLCLLFICVILGVHPIIGLLFEVLLLWASIVVMPMSFRYIWFSWVEPLRQLFITTFGNFLSLPPLSGSGYYRGSDYVEMTNVKVVHGIAFVTSILSL